MVELKDGSTVQSGRQRLNAGITQRTRSITPIDPSRSVAFASVQPVGGQNMAASNYAADDVIGVGSFTLGLTATQLILRRDTSPARAVVSWFVVELNGAPAPPPAALAYYAMDESAWTGAAGEVVDDSGNANHGTALGGAQTVDPGKVCRGGDIPANSTNSPPDAVDSGVDIDDDVGSQGTVSFWYRSDAAWSGGGGRTLADASTTTDNKYFYLVLRNNGRLRFGLEDSADRDFRLNTAVNSFAAGTWVHVAVTWNLPGDRLEIYIDGVLAASNTRNTSGALGELGTLYLGDNRSTYHPGGSANSADGVLDEVRIYDQALTASEIPDGHERDPPMPGARSFRGDPRPAPGSTARRNRPPSRRISPTTASTPRMPAPSLCPPRPRTATGRCSSAAACSPMAAAAPRPTRSIPSMPVEWCSATRIRSPRP